MPVAHNRLWLRKLSQKSLIQQQLLIFLPNQSRPPHQLMMLTVMTMVTTEMTMAANQAQKASVLMASPSLACLVKVAVAVAVVVVVGVVVAAGRVYRVM
jgi:hypothetical protein